MTVTNPTPAQILAVPMQPNDADAATIGDYLINLLSAVWRDQEGFSGKRPFGNSDWDYDLIGALVSAGMIDGALDEYGYVERADDEAGKRLIAEAIKSLRTPPAANPTCPVCQDQPKPGHYCADCGRQA